MLFSILLSFLAVIQPISCWGTLGHRTIAYLAEKYLTAESQRFVDILLVNNRGYDFSDASLFADKVKDSRNYTEQWHWIGMLTCGAVVEVT